MNAALREKVVDVIYDATANDPDDRRLCEIAADRVLALLAEGATTREPTLDQIIEVVEEATEECFNATEMAMAIQGLYWRAGAQGATGTAQPIAATLEEKPFSDEAGLRFARDMASDLFDNRLGWSDGRNPYAPRELWANLGAALYGEDDPRVTELRSPQPAEPRTMTEIVEEAYPGFLAAVEDVRRAAEGGDTLTPGTPPMSELEAALRDVYCDWFGSAGQPEIDRDLRLIAAIVPRSLVGEEVP